MKNQIEDIGTLFGAHNEVLEQPEQLNDGLWADYNDGSWPSCRTAKRFDVKQVSTSLGALNKYWPSLSCGSPKNCHGSKGLFWEHEWEKHGTCSASATGEEYNYFVTALNLYFKYNVMEVLREVLREAGYVASNSEKYPLGGVISAIQNTFHLTPEIECSGDAVEELYLCFYKDFKPRDCAVESNTRSGFLNRRNKKISASVLTAATVTWVVFEWLNYNFL